MVLKDLSTKERILKSAGDIFGQKGFRDATIRKIASDAKVNVAAINYHFRDKEGLYRAVLEDAFDEGFARFPADMALGNLDNPEMETEPSDPSQRLRAFIRAMFYRLHKGDSWGGMSGQGRLMARELLDPSPALETLVEKYINPHKDLLQEIIIEIMQTDPGPQKLMTCVLSIIGQCIYYALGSAVIKRVSFENSPTEENLDLLADNVWLFSLGGITKVQQEITKKERPTVMGRQGDPS